MWQQFVHSALCFLRESLKVESLPNMPSLHVTFKNLYWEQYLMKEQTWMPYTPRDYKIF